MNPIQTSWTRSQLSYEELVKAYQELDENSRVLVRTDLELHKAKNEVESRVAQLLILNKLSNLIHASQERTVILKTVCVALTSEIGFEKAWVYYHENDIQPLLVQHGASLNERPQLLEITERGLALQQGHSQPLLFHINRDGGDAMLRGLLMAIQTTQIMYAPLRCRDRDAGGIFVARQHSYPPITENDLLFLGMLSRQVAIALDNAGMHAEIVNNNAALEDRVALRSKELMEANTRLLELDRIKSNFISLVSHELRTPMTAIKGFSALLLEFESKMSMEQRRDYLRRIGDESDRLSRLIGDLLNISRIESGRIALRWEIVNIDAIGRGIFEQLRMQKFPIHYHLEVSPNLPSFVADADKLKQVILNLTANASRFTPANGTVSVLVDRHEDGVRIRVINPGEGIPFDQLSKIFDKFCRLENEANRQNPGTGLGLPICRGLVDLHGGKIWADSELHKQTTFTVLLPRNLDKLPNDDVRAQSGRAA